MNGESGRFGIGCGDWDHEDKPWCYVDKNCNLADSTRSGDYNLWWSNDVCDEVSVDLSNDPEPEPYFPNLDSCSCIRDTSAPVDGNGLGCGHWDTDGTWCYVSDDCSLEKTESGKYEGLFWSTEICDAENSYPGVFEAVALSASVEDFADKKASNSDIIMYAGCGVATAVAFFWHIKRTIA